MKKRTDLKACLTFMKDYQQKLPDIDPLRWTTLEQVEAAIDACHPSAPGPDGIPFLAYKRLKSRADPVLHKVLLRLMAVDGTPPP